MPARVLSNVTELPQPALLEKSVRSGLEARVVHFPKSFLERYDQRPGQLIEVLTIALSQFLAQERQRASN